MLTPKSLDSLTSFRHTLHQNPELSGQESATIERLTEYIQSIAPEATLEKIGQGLLAIFKGSEAGSTTMIRAELDALPISEINDLEYASNVEGVSHKCGHDGHMAIVAGLVHLLAENPVKKGKVILLFQSAEETGQGARWMLEDPAFEPYRPDFVFALHNLPCYPLGQALLKVGTFCAASIGLKIQLLGTTAHASHPETGKSPAGALSRLAPLMAAIPQAEGAFNDFVLVTVTHLNLGEPTFGVSPGAGEIWLTLRAYQDHDLSQLKSLIRIEADRIAKGEGLEVTYTYHEAFDATINHQQEVSRIKKIAEKQGLKVGHLEAPNRWSEDFGLFLQQSQGAMFGLGSGLHQPALHNPDYDFPDALLPTGTSLFWGLIQELNY